MAVGDRVQHRESGRTGTVMATTFSFGGAMLTRICWDAMGRLQEEHERTGEYQDGEFVYIGGAVSGGMTAVQAMEQMAQHRRPILINTDAERAFDLASETDRTVVTAWRVNGDGTVNAVHHQHEPRPAVDPVFNQQAIDLVQRGGLIQALLNADRRDIEAFRREFQGLPGVPGMRGDTGPTGSMGAMGEPGPVGARGRSFDDPTVEEEGRAARAFQQGVLDQSEDGPVISASAHAKAMQPKREPPKLFGGKRRITGLD